MANSKFPPTGKPDDVLENVTDARGLLWQDPYGRDVDNGGNPAVVDLDGSLEHENEFQAQGSDANKGGGTRADNPPPPWVS
jgi:hypothetical protein